MTLSPKPYPVNPLLVIVGPTASGKSDLAMKVAQKYTGEIICVDSRTVYKGMDIGAAKPSQSDQKAVRHWGLDLVDPGQRFTAADFKKYAQKVILDIQNRGKLPILVGGTGLYIDSILFNFGFRADSDLKKRAELEKFSIEQLQEIIKQQDYKMPGSDRNRRHLIRTIETGGQSGSKATQIRPDATVIGILPPDEVLKNLISKRADKNFDGLVTETRSLLNKYGEVRLAKTAGIAYLTSLRFLKGEISQNEAKKLIKTGEWQYARRQKTWFRRNPDIQWFGNGQSAYDFLTKHL